MKLQMDLNHDGCHIQGALLERKVPSLSIYTVRSEVEKFFP